MYICGAIKTLYIMATKFFIASSKKEGKAKLNVRFQSTILKVNYKMSMPIVVDVKEWENSRKGNTQKDNFDKKYPEVKERTDEIKRALDATLDRDNPISLEEFKKIVNSIVYRKEREAEQLRLQEEAEAERKANQMTLEKYIDIYIHGVETGEIRQAKNKPYKDNSIRNMKTFRNKFMEFQRKTGHKYDFHNMDKDFEKAFNKFLSPCKANTLVEAYKHLKSILHRAEIEKFEGVEINPYYEKFDSTFEDVDNIYLTYEDLSAINSVDLSGFHPHYTVARDLFLMMLWSCQRVSDLPKLGVPANIKRENIQIVSNGEIVNTELITISFRQEKTNKKAIIPVNPHLRQLLEKYEYQIPKMVEQKINVYIKEIAKMAGLTETVILNDVEYEKWECVTNHTARRTGCTYLYLAEWNPYDICKVSGHSSIKMLEKYIKASELEVSRKLAMKYKEILGF